MHLKVCTEVWNDVKQLPAVLASAPVSSRGPAFASFVQNLYHRRGLCEFLVDPGFFQVRLFACRHPSRIKQCAVA